jgi:fermentation-respiration switch protein FrsA (DUF1100 family)
MAGLSTDTRLYWAFGIVYTLLAKIFRSCILYREELIHVVVWIIGIALILFLSILTWLFSERVLRIRTWSMDHVLEQERADHRFSEEWYARLLREPIRIPSPRGYTLAGEYWPVAGNSRGIVILSHGVTVNRSASLKYAELFQSIGFSCLAYEQCRHGESGGRYTTYGYYERYDLQAVVDWVKGLFGGDILLGIHGESMGAAILLQYAGLVEDGADFYISDCAYASIWEQLAYQLRVQMHLPVWPLLHLTAWVCRLRCGFAIKEACPLAAVPHINNPVLFVHGEDDRYIPPDASMRLYEAKTNGLRSLLLVPGARHAQAQPMAPEQYKQTVIEFLDRAIKDWRSFVKGVES